MRKPKMILFDYGQTLLDEKNFDAVKGYEAVLRLAVVNPSGVTPAGLAAMSRTLDREIGRFNPSTMEQYRLEIQNISCSRYLYEYYGLLFDKDLPYMESVFWDVAAPGEPTPHVEELLAFLDERNIRTGVISNIAFGGEALRNRIDRSLPGHHFEFILASCEYVFRKPSPLLFELAARKAALKPEEIWYCGDNIFCDVKGAYEYGAGPVWYRGAADSERRKWTVRGQEQMPDCECLIIDDWRELIEHPLIRED